MRRTSLEEVIDLSGTHATRSAFERMGQTRDQALDLAEGALLIAVQEMDGAEPDLDASRRMLDRLAARAQQAVTPGAGTPERLVALHHVLFDEEGFLGDFDDYYHPDNALLPRVLERRRGLPILLSVVYVEVARRIGLEATGVAFPGHFLARCDVDDGFLIADPFYGGRFLDQGECAELLDEMTEGAADFDMEMLEPASTRQVLTRILANLRQMHLLRGDLARALRSQDCIVLVNPNAPDALRERAQLFARVGAHNRAAQDLEAFIERAMDPESIAGARAELDRARQLARFPN